MMSRLQPIGRCLGLVVVALVAAGCDVASAERTPTPPAPAATAPAKVLPSGDLPPAFRASISQVKTSWADGQQTFTLKLTNTGEKPETVHAIVYGRNDSITPPRRAVSPPTATHWFDLAESKDGRLTARDIEKNWKTEVFTARGSKLKRTWDVTVAAGETKSIQASHLLEDASPFSAHGGKKYAKQGFSDYSIWLYTNDGTWFFEKNVSAARPDEEKPPIKPEPTKPAATKPDPKPPATKPDIKPLPTKPDPKTPAVDPKIEEEAATLLKLAQYYVDNKKADRARDKLTQLLDKFPQTEAAKAGRQLMRDLKGP